MRIEIKSYTDNWQEIKDAAMFTMGKSIGKYPDSTWKKKILLAEHSPIRLGKITFRCYDAPSFVIGHITRHKFGIEFFVRSLRYDRASYDEVPNRNTPNNFEFEADFQALINISRRRLCTSASKETREFWNLVRDEVAKIEPELADVMRKECVYRGACTEMRSCGYCNTDAYKKELKDYREV